MIRSDFQSILLNKKKLSAKGSVLPLRKKTWEYKKIYVYLVICSKTNRRIKQKLRRMDASCVGGEVGERNPGM